MDESEAILMSLARVVRKLVACGKKQQLIFVYEAGLSGFGIYRWPMCQAPPGAKPRTAWLGTKRARHKAGRRLSVFLFSESLTHDTKVARAAARQASPPRERAAA
jgi:hypothetical protein